MGTKVLGDNPFANGDDDAEAGDEQTAAAKGKPRRRRASSEGSPGTPAPDAAPEARAGDEDAAEPSTSSTPAANADARATGAEPAERAATPAEGARHRRGRGRRDRGASAGPPADEPAPSSRADEPPPSVPADPLDDDLSSASSSSLVDAAPDTVPPDEAFDDIYYGGEATPAPGDYGPGLDKRKELPYTRKSVTEEVRELERRVKARLTPAFPIEHRRKLPLEFLWRRYRDLAMRDRSDVVDEFGRDPMYAAKIEPLLDFLYNRYFRVETQGLDHLPPEGRGLVVANHSGTLPYDGAMLMVAVRKETGGARELRPLVEDFVFHFPYLGTFINRIGGVRACQENAERLLARDQLVGVFPEGIKGIGKTYRERYRLQRFGRGGFIKLALRTGAPIVPVAIVGAEEIHPMLAKITFLAKSIGVPYVPVTPTFPLLGPLGLLPIPTKWTIRFGEPLDVAARYGADAIHDRILVNKLAETVRSRIQEMIDEILAARRSVLFG